MVDHLSKSILFIGAGKIAPFHIQSAKRAGFKLAGIANYKETITSQELLKNYDFEFRSLVEFENIHKLNISAVSIITTTETHISSYLRIRGLRLPTLIEKPVCLFLKDLEVLKPFDSNVIVGYNRRHYFSTQELKLFLKNMPTFTADIEIFENSWGFDKRKEDVNRILRENSVHIFDLMLYLFGELTIIQKATVSDNSNLHISCLLKDVNGNILNLKILFGVPGNYGIRVYSNGQTIELSPIESIEIFRGMKMIPATQDFPIKQYQPISEYKAIPTRDNLNFKPGFVPQYLELYEMCQGKNPLISATLEDEKRNLNFVEEIIKDILL